MKKTKRKIIAEESGPAFPRQFDRSRHWRCSAGICGPARGQSDHIVALHGAAQ
jgi:hypothetical protein